MPESRRKWHIDALTADDVNEIVGWQYAPPYEMYNPSETLHEVFLNPVYQYYAVRDSSGRLMGYCCYGPEGRVLGGDYPEHGKPTLDVGVAMTPELVGRGLGGKFVGTVLTYGELKFQHEQFRVTIAEFNVRSLKTFVNQRFEPVNKFTRTTDALAFVQLIGKPKFSTGSTKE